MIPCAKCGGYKWFDDIGFPATEPAFQFVPCPACNADGSLAAGLEEADFAAEEHVETVGLLGQAQGSYLSVIWKTGSRWVLTKTTSSSGKSMFVCVCCGRLQPFPDKRCQTGGCDEIEAMVLSKRDSNGKG